MILLATHVLYFILSFNAGSRSAPLIWDGPWSRAECMRFEREASGIWCQPIRVRRWN